MHDMNAKPYTGMVPPCGIFCGTCPRYLRTKAPCPGAAIQCPQRQCKSFYVCCTQKKGLRFCHECSTFPCSRYKQFTASWEHHGQDLLENQRQLQALGEEAWLTQQNAQEDDVETP